MEKLINKIKTYRFNTFEMCLFIAIGIIVGQVYTFIDYLVGGPVYAVVKAVSTSIFGIFILFSIFLIRYILSKFDLLSKED